VNGKDFEVLIEPPWNPNPTEEDCKQALAGNICCCGNYPRHPTAIMEAAENIKGGA